MSSSSAGREPAAVGGILRVMGMVVAIGVGLLVLWKVLVLLPLIFAAVLLAVILHAVSAWVAGITRMPFGLSLTSVLVLALGAFATMIYLLSPMMAEQARELRVTVIENWHQLQTDLRDSRLGRLIWLREGADESPPAAAPEPGLEEENAEETPRLNSETRRQIAERGPELLWSLAGVFSTAAGAIGSFLLIFVLALFFAARPRLYRDGLLRLVPLSRRRRVAQVLDESAYALRWWMIGQGVSMAVLGIVITVGLGFLGVPLAPMLGLVAAVCTFVPYLGPIVASIPALLMAWSVSATVMLYAAIFLVVVQNLEGAVLTPLIQHRAVHLPPALTLLSEMLAALIWGIPGVIIATPLLAATIVFIKHFYVEDALGDSFEKPAEREKT